MARSASTASNAAALTIVVKSMSFTKCYPHQNTSCSNASCFELTAFPLTSNQYADISRAISFWPRSERRLILCFFPLLFHLTPLKWNFLWNWLTFLVTLVCGLSFYERMTFVEQATGDRNSIELGGKSTQTHRKDQMKNNALKWINTKRITSSAAVYMPWMPNKRFAVVFCPDI